MIVDNRYRAVQQISGAYTPRLGTACYQYRPGKASMRGTKLEGSCEFKAHLRLMDEDTRLLTGLEFKREEVNSPTGLYLLSVEGQKDGDRQSSLH